MNQKHLASVILLAVIIAFAQGILTLNKKRQSAQDAAEAAESKLATTVSMRTSSQQGLEKTRESTSPLRKYFRMWLPEFEKYDNAGKAKTDFLQTLKRVPGLALFESKMAPTVPVKDSNFVNQRVSGIADFEGDFKPSLQLLSMIERELPTSRISSVEIRKGDRANNVRVNAAVDFPIIASPAEVKK